MTNRTDEDEYVPNNLAITKTIDSLGFIVAMKIVYEEGGYTLASILGQLEQSVIEATLITCMDNKSETARRLGISRTALQYKIKEYGSSKEKLLAKATKTLHETAKELQEADDANPF